MTGHVWVVVPAPGEGVTTAAWEPLAAARVLAAGLGAKVAALVVGPGPGDVLVRARGLAEAAVHVDGPGLEAFASGTYAAAAAKALEGRNPAAVLTLADGRGRELAPRLAVRLGGAPLTEISQVEVSDNRPVFGRPVFGGKAVARLVAESAPAVVSIKPGAFELPADGPESGEAPHETVAFQAAAPDVDVVSREAAKVEGVPLDAAPVVVSGGRGVGGPDPFRHELKELADLLGGAVGASLAAVDAGWVPQSMQVGQTGTAVAPTVYIAVGISGASQHLAGISGARHVVAINKDKDAPIFRVADVGIVGDFKTLIPALLKAVRARG